MHVSIVGVRGIPNNYGGFETLAEYLAEYLSPAINITVYCSSKDMNRNLKEYKGAVLKYVAVTSHGALGIIYDSICLSHAVANSDVVLFLGFGGGFIMPFFSKKSKNKIVLNIGGLDWKRSKWSAFSQMVIKNAEKLLVKNCGIIIADNLLIQKYIADTYNRTSVYIPYGGDQATKQEITPEVLYAYPFLNSSYAFTVTRIQHDNNIELILDSFAAQAHIPLVIVGNWGNSEYGRRIKEKYTGLQQLILLDAIYDRKKLDVLRSNCTVYIHGHSAGGTNPSLVEAMYLGLPVFAFASGYNEITTKNKAFYFKTTEQLTSLLNCYRELNLTKIGLHLQQVAKRDYIWRNVADKYKKVFSGWEK